MVFTKLGIPHEAHGCCISLHTVAARFTVNDQPVMMQQKSRFLLFVCFGALTRKTVLSCVTDLKNNPPLKIKTVIISSLLC